MSVLCFSTYLNVIETSSHFIDIVVRDRYQQTGAYYEFYPLEGKGHGVWETKVNGKSLYELAFDFVVKTQNLMVME